MTKLCRWVYRPGTNNSCWAVATCDHIMRYLSRINPKDNESIGCADWYNGKLCYGCGKPIQMDYTLIKIVGTTLDELNAELTAEELGELEAAENNHHGYPYAVQSRRMQVEPFGTEQAATEFATQMALEAMDNRTEPQIEMTEDEKIDFVAARILREHKAALEELAK